MLYFVDFVAEMATQVLSEEQKHLLSGLIAYGVQGLISGVKKQIFSGENLKLTMKILKNLFTTKFKRFQFLYRKISNKCFSKITAIFLYVLKYLLPFAKLQLV